MSDESIHIAGDLLATTARDIAAACASAFAGAKLDVSSEVAVEGDGFSLAIYPDRDAVEGGRDFLVGGNLWLEDDAADGWIRAFVSALERATIGYSLEVTRGAEVEVLRDPRHDQLVARRTAPAAPAMAIAWTLDRGRIAVGDRLRAGAGDEVRTGWLANDPSTHLLVTLTGKHADSPEHLRKRYGFAVDGIAPLEYLGAAPGTPYADALVERVVGTAASPVIPKARLARVGGELAAAVARAHAAGEALGGIRPELVFVTDGGATLAPRGPTFIATTPLARGMRSYVVPYLSPEELLANRRVPASDVFALCATLYFLGTGRHPFGDPDDVTGIAARLATGSPDPWPGALGELLARGMRQAERERPAAPELAEALAKLA